jgi:Protein of unknown function (DUF3800)
MHKRIHIDESGDPVLNNDCYVICAVLNDVKDVKDDLALLSTIRDEHGIGVELKSSKIGRNLKRRIVICKSLTKLKGRFINMVIKKDRLKKDGGFRFKPSTYKYCQRRLFEKIYKGINQVTVVVDTHGSQDFMNSFKPYIEKHFQPNLFSKQDIVYSIPIESELLQVADFIGGTIRRYMEGDDDSSAYNIIKSSVGFISVWPRAKDDLYIDDDSSPDDMSILRHCTYVAEEVLKNEMNPILTETLQHLLYSNSEDDNGFIYGDILLDNLKKENLIDLSKDKAWLRTSVIAKLRKKGVPIAASRNGYKIPSSVEDLAMFVNFVAQKTIPYLEKVNHMRENIYIGLAGKYDMLDHEPRLKDLMAPLRDS